MWAALAAIVFKSSESGQLIRNISIFFIQGGTYHMPHNKIKDALSAVNSVIANRKQFAVNPAKDFSRQRKITPDTLISFCL